MNHRDNPYSASRNAADSSLVCRIRVVSWVLFLSSSVTMLLSIPGFLLGLFLLNQEYLGVWQIKVGFTGVDIAGRFVSAYEAIWICFIATLVLWSIGGLLIATSWYADSGHKETINENS